MLSSSSFYHFLFHSQDIFQIGEWLEYKVELILHLFLLFEFVMIVAEMVTSLAAFLKQTNCQ